MKRITVGLSLVAAALTLVALAYPRPPSLAHHIVASASSIRYTLQDLQNAAEIIAVVKPTGKDSEHWNNAKNSAWVSEKPGRAMIYNDQEVVVVDVIRGQAPSTLTIRNIGGTVGDTMYELEGLEPLEQGAQYLVFLKTFQTPTEEGTEAALSFVGQDQGVFMRSGDAFANDLGLSVTPDMLQE